jgi:hypothetical protein
MTKPQEVPPEVRAYADGIKLALHELAEDEPETLRAFVMATWMHMTDGANKWLGAKILAILSGALVALALWLISKAR